VASGQQRLAAELTGRHTPGLAAPGRFQQGVVATVTAGAAADGNARVTVNCDDGVTVAMPYNANYTPTVGHVVLLAVQGTQRVVICRVIGTP
jgi:hypothetical protein